MENRPCCMDTCIGQNQRPHPPGRLAEGPADVKSGGGGVRKGTDAVFDLEVPIQRFAFSSSLFAALSS